MVESGPAKGRVPHFYFVFVQSHCIPGDFGCSEKHSLVTILVHLCDRAFLTGLLNTTHVPGIESMSSGEIHLSKECTFQPERGHVHK